ncbi:Ferrochelatase, mitochondrial [Halotydeus destructor]|nr:Ferrochelatase, mitochondrial [Halotydeus destructor]
MFFPLSRQQVQGKMLLKSLSHLVRHASTGSKPNPRTGILMLNMGGPSTTGEVEAFLTRLFTDTDIMRLPIQSKLGPLIAKRRAPAVAAKYQEIGGGSPIRAWTEKQGQLLVESLDKLSPETGPHKFYVGFRYAEPLMEDALEQMERDGIKRAVAFSQYPQYSCSTSGSSFNALAKYMDKNDTVAKDISWSLIDRWSLNKGLIESIQDLIRTELDKLPSQVADRTVILFSAHSLPMQVVNRGDTYPMEVGSTVQAVMASLGRSNAYRLVWQSKVGPLPWLSPQTDDAIKGYAKQGFKNFMLVPIAFVNEHIETLHELDIEYAHDLAKELKVESIIRVPAPNDHPKFIAGMADLVRDHLSSGSICSPQIRIRCPLCTNAACEVTRRWIKQLDARVTHGAQAKERKSN